MKITSKFGFVFLIFVILSFFAVALQAKTVTGGVVIVNADIAFEELHKGQATRDGRLFSKSIRVLENEQQYKDALASYQKEVSAKVDFSQGKVLLLDLGQRNTGGYTVAITGLEDRKDYVVVKVGITHPGSNCMLTQSLTNPFQFSYIATRKKLLIVENVIYHECN